VSNKQSDINNHAKIKIVFSVGGKNTIVNTKQHGMDAIRNHVKRLPVFRMKLKDLSEICPAIGSFTMFHSPYTTIATVINIIGRKISVS
jgi:hypothetical protein